MKATEEPMFVVTTNDGTKYVRMQHRYIRFTEKWHEATFFNLDSLNKMLLSHEAVNELKSAQNAYNVFKATLRLEPESHSYNNAIKLNALSKLTDKEIEILGLKRIMIND